jgi:hypothetical protein
MLNRQTDVHDRDEEAGYFYYNLSRHVLQNEGRLQEALMLYRQAGASRFARMQHLESIGRESELFTFPVSISNLRVHGVTTEKNIHPIVVSHEPAKVKVAALGSTGMPSVLSRSDWGADSDYLFESPSDAQASSTADTSKGDTGAAPAGQPDNRVNDCLQAQQKYPTEFSVASVTKKDAQGRTYLWPLQYSKDIKLLVVHHTALLVRGDPRPAVERVRALYKYHAVTKGWGDVGYHYIIDENGQVYEGRQGGDNVVGGHSYCNNVGTIGIVLMGNFEIEQPTQVQTKSLQSLLKTLADKYHIDPNRSVQFHGKTFDAPIVRHRDTVSTLCPGYYLAEAFSQIVSHVKTGNLDAAHSIGSLGYHLRFAHRTARWWNKRAHGCSCSW